MRTALVLFIVIICFSSALASEDAAAFLDIKVGARATAMGCAYTAVVSDVSAVYWNPAALGSQKRFQLVTSVLNYSIGNGSAVDKIGGGHYFLALGFPVGKIGTIGFGWKRFSLGDIEIRQDEETALGTFDDSENALFFAWGYELVDRTLSVGLNLRFVQQSFSGIHGAQAHGAGIGLGVLCHLAPSLKLGISVEDDFQLKWENGVNDKVPFKGRVGLAYTTLKNHLTVAVDLEQKRNWPIWGSFGLEYRLSPRFMQTKDGQSNSGFAIRAGLSEVMLEDRYPETNFHQADNLNGGFGLFWDERHWHIKFDYAYGVKRLGMRHRFTISIGL